MRKDLSIAIVDTDFYQIIGHEGQWADNPNGPIITTTNPWYHEVIHTQVKPVFKSR